MKVKDALVALQSSGAISVDNIRTEFGRTGQLAFNQLYKGGGIVPSSLTDTVTAGSTSSSSNNSGRGGVDQPFAFNTNTSLVKYSLWSDNGAANVQTASWTVDKTATYNFSFTYYYGGFGNSHTATIVLAKNGSNVVNQGLASNDSSQSHSATVSAQSGDTISMSFSGSSSGWSSNTFSFGGDSTSTRVVTVGVNANVPTSGAIDLQDFYSATNSM